MPIYLATAHWKVLEYFLPNVWRFKRLEENIPELFGLSFGEFCLLKTEEEASSALAWWRDHTDKKHAEQRANVDHFELSRNRTAPHMSACQYMSHFVHDLRSWWLVRDQIASDHCRSVFDQIWLPARTLGSGGVPFPDVNLPDFLAKSKNRATFKQKNWATCRLPHLTRIIKTLKVHIRCSKASCLLTKVDKPKASLWWAKALKNKLICEG